MFATINGVRLHYESEGDGPACLVVSIASIPFYQRIFSAALREHLRLIFVDLRGSGESESGPVERITLDTFADDIDALRQHLGLAKVVIIGHSLHGWLALDYARKYPQHTAGVVSIGISPRRGDGAVQRTYWETMAGAERKVILAENLARLTPDALASLSPTQQFVARYLAGTPRVFRDPRFDWAFLWEGCEWDMAVFNRVWRELLAEYDPTPGFPAITCPVFIAVGIFDYGNPPLIWAEAKERLPDATYHVFEESGHDPMYEEQALFDARLLTWLRGVNPGNVSSTAK